MMPVQSNSQTIPVTVIMLTLNEEFNLPGAIDNVKDWAEEVFIVDSCSTDRTVDIALERGVKIVQRPFTNFGDQWNFALDHLPVATPWTLKLDPDERLSEKLKDSIAKVVTNGAECDGYEMVLRLWFMGKPLHVQQPVLRLWRTGKCRFSNVIVNEHPLVDGKIGRLEGLMEHFDSSDLHHWVDKQNRYTTMEAIMRASGAALAVQPRLLGNPLERRMFFKKYFFRIPFRFQLLFLYHLIVCGVWRNGAEGWTWARLRTEVFRATDLKTREILKTGRIPELSKVPHGDYDARVLASPLQQVFMQETKD
ncbi:MAG: glycosyltransferase family 2 protein [Desulfobacterales bacterium]|nr:glycosyltransferase family 2 protein [Desulfobacterales bacterium]